MNNASAASGPHPDVVVTQHRPLVAQRNTTPVITGNHQTTPVPVKSLFIQTI